MTPPVFLQRCPVGATKSFMSRNRGTEYGAALVRLALLALVALFAVYVPAQAEGLLDISTLRTNQDLSPYLRTLSTEQKQIIVEMPPNAAGKVESLSLESVGNGPMFQWKILALTNNGTTPRNMVLVIDNQRFAGSGIIRPLAPGSVVLAAAQTGGAQISSLAALSHDAFSIDLAPATSAALAFQVSSDTTSVMLWDRESYDLNVRSLAFFRGALLGINLLLVVTVILLFTSQFRLPLLAGGLFTLSATAFMAFEAGYLSQPFWVLGFFNLKPVELRAIIESFMVISALLCFGTMTEVRRGAPMLFNASMMLAMLALALPVYAFIDPELVSTLARVSFALVTIAAVTELYLLRSRKPARVTIVQWSLLLGWVVIAMLAALGDADGFPYSPLLLLGLTIVLIAFVYGFTKTVAGDGLISQHIFQEAGRRGLALAGAQQYVWDWHPQDRQFYVSEELERALGHPQGTFRQAGSEALLDIMHPADRTAYLAALETTERRGRGFISRDIRLQRGDGTYRWFELRARGMSGPDSRLVRAIGTLSDITNTKRSEERLLNDAVYDQVTGLPNRALLLDRLNREISIHHIENLYVMLLDIDRFKDINDGLGFDAGDGLLNVVGRRISSLADPEDTVARLPGNQFAILVPNAGPNRNVPKFAEAVCALIAQPVEIKNQEVFLTAHLGVARYRQLGQTADQFMKDAAIALYEAKRRGNENVQLFQPSMRDERGELVALEGELRRALERNEIEVHYQPIARLRDMDIAGFEALVRWRHPALGLMPPESFLEVAEQTNMIRDIGRFVLNEATRQLGIWQRAFRPTDPVFMAVNVSASQLLESDLVTDIGAAIIREAVYRQTLKIEITESVVMQYPEKASGLLERIKQLGVGLACDDFGTGYSSLSSLRNLPFDTLKVDRSFITPDPSDDRAAVILEAVIALAHDLGLTIVAEGIENQAQVDRLGSLMCDYGQGYFIGAPMTAKQVTETLAALPYVQDYGKSVISSLLERAEADSDNTLNPVGLSTTAIERALKTQTESQRAEPNLGLAATAVATLAPPPGLSPMAPRVARPQPASPQASLKPRRAAAKREKQEPAAKKKTPAKKAKAKRS